MSNPTYFELVDENQQLREALLKKTEELQQLKQRTVAVENWKGKSGIETTKEPGGWKVIEYRKDSKNGMPKAKTHLIPQHDVDAIRKIVEKQIPLGHTLQYKEFVGAVIEHLKEQRKIPYDVDINNFAGGKNREPYYFCLLYYPLKILQSLRIIEHGGHGSVTRLQ